VGWFRTIPGDAVRQHLGAGFCGALGRDTDGLAAGARGGSDPITRQRHGARLSPGTSRWPQRLARNRRLLAARISPEEICPGAPAGREDVILAVSERLNLERAGVRREDLPARMVWFKDRVLPQAVLAVLEG